MGVRANAYRQVGFFDTTLRDGEQAPGNSMSPETKVRLFAAFDAAGVDYIEAGFPSASAQDFATVQELARRPRRARVTAFARANATDIDNALAALDGQPNTQLQVLLTGSEIHVEHKRRMTPEEIIDETRTAVSYAAAQGVEDLSLGYEDSSRGRPEFLRRVVEAGVESGGTTVVLADTVGGSTPSEIASLVALVRSWIGDAARISMHCHNDMGLAVANTLAAIKAGADVVQTTFCGIGERTGNAAIEEVATVLHYKGEEYRAGIGLDLKLARQACEAVLRELGLELWKHKPILGRYAFSTAAGVHASGMANAPITYEFVEPDLFGRKRETLLNRASGRANLRVLMEQQGASFDDALLDEMYALFIADSNPMRFNDPDDFAELYARASDGVAASVNAG